MKMSPHFRNTAPIPSSRMRQNPSRLPSGARKDGAQFESPSSPNSSPQFEPLTGNLSQSMLLKALI
jgi:hypothetical protein